MKLMAKHDACIRLITICDPHLSAHNPGAWGGEMSYEEHNAGMMRQVFRFAAKQEVDAIVCGGDIFHLKTPTRNPLDFVIRTARLFKEAPCPLVGIAGNHDMRSGSFANNIGPALEALIEMGAYHLLDEEPLLIRMDFAALETRTVAVAGASYDHAMAESFMAIPRTGDVQVNVGHFAFGLESGTFYGEPVFGPDTLGAGDFDVAVIGHHHTDQGIPKVGGKIYMAHGSTAWTSVHKADKGRHPKAGYLEVTPEGVTSNTLRLKTPEFSELINVAAHEAAVEEGEELEAFLQTLGGVEFAGLDPGSILGGMKGLEGTVRERVEAYLEAAEA